MFSALSPPHPMSNSSAQFHHHHHHHHYHHSPGNRLKLHIRSAADTLQDFIDDNDQALSQVPELRTRLHRMSDHMKQAKFEVENEEELAVIFNMPLTGLPMGDPRPPLVEEVSRIIEACAQIRQWVEIVRGWLVNGIDEQQWSLFRHNEASETVGSVLYQFQVKYFDEIVRYPQEGFRDHYPEDDENSSVDGDDGEEHVGFGGTAQAIHGQLTPRSRGQSPEVQPVEMSAVGSNMFYEVVYHGNGQQGDPHNQQLG